jgi:threonine dehydrogenase-like Zn-dependent dehydrogenase
MEGGKIQSELWITHRASFASLNEVFPRWMDRNSGVIKAMIIV